MARRTYFLSHLFIDQSHVKNVYLSDNLRQFSDARRICHFMPCLSGQVQSLDVIVRFIWKDSDLSLPVKGAE